MAPTKNIKKGTTRKKVPPKERSLASSTEESRGRTDQRREYRSLRSTDELRSVMGAESDDALSNSENDSYHSNTNQSRPNFSFLPSHKHSSPNKSKSPNKNTTATAHRLASMPTVPNTDQEESVSSSVSTPRKSPRGPSVANSKSSRKQAQPSTGRQSHHRKQKAPGQMKTLKEIIHLQGTVHNLIPKMCFARLIREVLTELSNRSLRVTAEMLLCLQEASEIYLVQLFEDSYRCTLHRDRVTLIPKDMQLAFMLRRFNS